MDSVVVLAWLVDGSIRDEGSCGDEQKGRERLSVRPKVQTLPGRTSRLRQSGRETGVDERCKYVFFDGLTAGVVPTLPALLAPDVFWVDLTTSFPSDSPPPAFTPPLEADPPFPALPPTGVRTRVEEDRTLRGGAVLEMGFLLALMAGIMRAI